MSRLLLVLFLLRGAFCASARCALVGPPVERAASEAQMKEALQNIELVDDKGVVFDLRAALRARRITIRTWRNFATSACPGAFIGPRRACRGESIANC